MKMTLFFFLHWISTLYQQKYKVQVSNSIGTSLGVIIDLFDNSFSVSYIVVTILEEYNSKFEKVVLSLL